MESTGEGETTHHLEEIQIFINAYHPIASKIHITSEVNDELQLIGGFRTEPRGLIDVKVYKLYGFF
jgi:hypothetical protein